MVDRSFPKLFLSSIKTVSKFTGLGFPDAFIPPAFPNDHIHSPHYLSILAGGHMSITYPYNYDIERLEAYCILYTEEGSGYLKYEGRTYYLDPGSLIFIDCLRHHHIEIQHSPWKQKIMYLQGSPLIHYFRQFSESKDVIFFVGKSSYLPDLIDNILNTEYSQDYLSLMQNRKLTDFLTELIIKKRHGYLSQTETSSHVKEMKYMFDSHCEFHFTLEWLENHFQISRYRLCREFKASEGLSIISYLNSVRINTAKNLLVSTEMRINEIGAAVGIDNTNHFIQLFKASTGTTPSKYRN